MKNVRFNRFCLIYMQRCHTNLFSHFISVHEGFFSLLVVEIKIKRKIFAKEQPKKLLLGNFLFLQLLKEFEYIQNTFNDRRKQTYVKLHLHIYASGGRLKRRSTLRKLESKLWWNSINKVQKSLTLDLVDKHMKLLESRLPMIVSFKRSQSTNVP